MKLWIALIALLPTVGPAFAQADKAGCKDHPLFPTRMPGYVIRDCRVEDFGFYELLTRRPPKLRVEGKVTFITYGIPDRNSPQASGLQVVRNYEAALRKVGGTEIATDANATWWVHGKVTKDGREAWAEAQKGNGTIWLHIVEKQGMAQHVTADAAGLGSDLESTGHVAVYGINFDTNKAEVRLDSKPALDEIAKLLKQTPTLKLKVVGHTDMTGVLDANMKLSQARAEAVVQALVSQYGIAAGRLKGYGVGPLAPVATNDNDDGRGKNRRVELVKE